ncbi:glycoside hydrolase family 3 N-terminal domain-containing protein [Corynebacterium pseudotuberculosis]|uniref:glycoside hydrolase family 3 N-terminal domain-containing protein n=1 Tax=Corynebacterium pseudotuberculosis TaxID=1719 RepID=UPI000947970E|nr:glycoside hydrolase family 3 N-terminal domain-containing protein [Corynebacterium pseudotuberculosis]
MHMKRLLAAALLGVLAACSDAGTNTDPTSTEATTALTTQETSAPASAKPQPEDVRAKAASLMMVGVSNYDDALAALNQGAGGIFIGSGTDPNLLTAPDRNIQALRKAVGRDLSVSTDFEGGRVLRHQGILGTFPSPQVMAQTMNPEQVRGMAKAMGDSLLAHGVTVNFAPVADIDAGLDVVGDRAFSADPNIDAEYATAFAQGMLDAGVRPVFKHFPGHGRASGDSHTGQVFTPSLGDLENIDLVPYGRINIPGAGVMLGHMVVPDLGAPQNGLPSTLNPAAYQLLRTGAYRDGRPFAGVVYTDDLAMGAITGVMPIPQAVVASLQAGADQALWVTTAGLKEAIDATVAAVETGTYPRAQFEESVRRVGVVTPLGRLK